MSQALKNVNVKSTAQSMIAREDQVKNNAGGYVFTVTPKARLERFLILGTDGGTYYANQSDHTAQAVDFLRDLAEKNTRLLVDTTVEVSDAGRAHKNSPAIFALAVALTFAPAEEKAYVQDAVNKVVRTGTHIFEFSQYIDNLGGWGRAKRRAVANWYESKSPDQQAFQAVKYRQRDGWTHRDVLRLSHAKPDSAVARFILGKDISDFEIVPDIITGFKRAQTVKSGAEAKAVISEYKNLPWEAFPTEIHKSPEFWSGLFYAGALPVGALLRNITRFAKMDMFNDMTFAADVSARLTDAEAIKKARLHPMNYLLASRTYEGASVERYGYNARTFREWTINSEIAGALEDGFYAAFTAIEPSNKRHLLALDVSASMGWGFGSLGLTAREISAVMSMVTARTEPKHIFKGFSNSLVDLNITKRQNLNTVIKNISSIPFGGTDCALPMIWAESNNVEVDAFVVYTDNETWAGRVHPFQALKNYRRASGIDAKLIVVGATATNFSIADPRDPGMLDVVGFDTTAPSVIANFVKG